MAPLAAIFVGGRDWVPPALGVLAVVAIVLVMSYGRLRSDRRTKLLAGLLKTVGFLLLVLCLVEPLWSTTRARPGENLFLILADNSRSLDIQGVQGSARGDWMRRLLASSGSPASLGSLSADTLTWQSRLAQDFDVRRYQFDARLQAVDHFDHLTFDGQASSLDAVLSTLAARYASQPLAGLLVFTDGNGTGVPLTEEQLRQLPPVYAVLPPDDAPRSDVSVVRATVSETRFEDAPVTVQAEVAAEGMAGEGVVCQLVDAGGDIVSEQTAQVETERPLTFRFQVQPRRPGVVFYTIRVAPAGEVERTFGDAPDSREATIANNVRQVAVNRDGNSYRVLYVGGRPNWEYKSLRRGVETDPQIDLVGFLRIARREAKFEFLGRADESSNPLFRGFKKAGDEETESYDQPVIIRLNTRDEAELRDGFPKERAELYQYDALILDDIEAEFFTHDQLALIERFVSERGGGLMMLGGPDTFRHGRYARTPVANALPVYLDREVAGEAGGGYRFKLTRDGWLEPWMRLRDNEAGEKARLAEMPEFRSVSRVESVKPAAQVLATVSVDGRTQYPAVISQPYGHGRVLAVMIGDLWRWGLQRPIDGPDDLGKSWRQMVRWLLTDVPRRLEPSLVREVSVGSETTQIAIRVRDENFQPQENASLTLVVSPAAGEQVPLEAEPSVAEAGLFEASYSSREPGAYRVDVTQTDNTGATRTASLGWTSNPAAEEFREVTINRKRMEELARFTQGEVVPGDQLEDFVASLPTRKVPLTQRWSTPLWHRSWVFLLVTLCLAGEWGLRRWRGLP